MKIWIWNFKKIAIAHAPTIKKARELILTYNHFLDQEEIDYINNETPDRVIEDDYVWADLFPGVN